MFLRKLGKKYTLPTGKEWEYACRSGSNKKFYWGNTELDIHYYANCFVQKTHSQIEKNGSLKCNNFGLHDMLGNVSEWCNRRNWDTPYTKWLTCATQKKRFPSFKNDATGGRLCRVNE